jgi:nitrite reductase/ring-hydroxylating ferredoxin subunit
VTESTSQAVANLKDLPIGSMKLVHVDGHRVLLVRTSEGISALDNACPHEGYGLAQGDLNGNTLTCEWHNWKFDAFTGECTQGEENVVSHDVDVDEHGNIHVAWQQPADDLARQQRIASLQRGIESNYPGQIARDLIRLLRLSADPGELVRLGLNFGVPRGEWGWGHSIAAAADCLSMTSLYDGDERAFPLVQALAGIAEEGHLEPARVLAPPMRSASEAAAPFRELVEHEGESEAQSLIRAHIESGASRSELHKLFLGPLADHHLSYGHGAIYTHKAFELLDAIGWDCADTVLGHLVTGLILGTREDRLPYMRPWTKSVSGFDHGALIDIPADPSWDPTTLTEVILSNQPRQAVATATKGALRNGAGVTGLINAASLAASIRMLRYDVSSEDDLSDDFNWLDITHGMTYANAARYHHNITPGVDSLKLALHSVFLAHWTGRHEWHAGVHHLQQIVLSNDDLLSAGQALQRQSILDPGGIFIVTAHVIKTAVAATHEAVTMRNPLPLQAAQRFAAAPHRRRFVAEQTQQALDQLRKGSQDR